MFSELPKTPRPVPPAKARKASLLSHCYPPPPYSSADSVLGGSPIPITVQLLEASPDLNMGSPTHEDWMVEKSREELSDLLLRADKIIKSRESELGLTSAICKSLYQDNVVLKNKHDFLISRLPNSYMSPIGSPADSPQFRSISLTRSANGAGISRTSSPTYDISSIRRTRRISMTQTEIGELADQNAELLVQIEKLEKEAQEADQFGKRKLRKLEQEIQGLREELYKTQEELEEAEKVAHGVGNEELQRQRKEREEKLFALRSKHGTNDDPEVLDFAPSSSQGPSAPSRSAPIHQVRGHTTSSSLSILDQLEHAESTSYSSFPNSVRRKDGPAPEHALISQLLGKIRELEETNQEISEQQHSSIAKLRYAQRGAESMMRVYECLNEEEDVEVEIVSEFDQEGASTTTQDGLLGDATIKFRSLRRSIDEDIFKQLRDEQGEFENDIDGHMRSTVRSGDPFRFHKSRKSVVGFFESRPVSTTPGLTEHGSSLLSFLDEDFDPKRLPPLTIFSGSNSPAGSSVSSAIDVGSSKSGKTLGSELGSDFGEDWNMNAGNYHLRTTSLHSLAQLSEGLPSPDRTRMLEQDLCESDFGFQVEQAKLRDGEPEDEKDEPVAELGSYREKSNLRSQRLLRTVRSRMNRRFDWRLETSAFLQASTEVKPETVQPTEDPTSAVLTNVFETVVENIVGTSASQCEVSDTEEDLYKTEDTKVIDIQSSDHRVKSQGFVGLVLELWLWLQFIIIIMVFLWAMAKRGPKSVLQEKARTQR